MDSVQFFALCCAATPCVGGASVSNNHVIVFIQLVLRDNDLVALPPEIGNLIRLRELHIQGNRLTVLPPEMGECRVHCNLLSKYQHRKPASAALQTQSYTASRLFSPPKLTHHCFAPAGEQLCGLRFISWALTSLSAFATVHSSPVEHAWK